MNIIVICLDTLRRDFLGCYGNNDIRTPFIDAFAKKTAKFNSAYIGSFPTIPMRVDTYTGRTNWPAYGWKAPDPGQRTLQQYLKEAGFGTCLVYDTPHYNSSGLNKCFDEAFFIKKPVEDGVSPGDIVLPFPRENVRQDGSLYITDKVQTSHYKYESDWFVSRTMIKAGDWLEDNYRKDGFFLWVDTFEIHEDWNTPDYYIEMYSRDYQGIDYSYPNYGYTDIYSKNEIERLKARYSAEVTLTDKWTGFLLKKIEDMDLLKNTMVVITSDHGMYLGEHGRMGKHTVLEDDPWPLYEEVSAVPLLIYTPWQPTFREYNGLVEPSDLMPTFLDVLNIPFDSKGLTGKSILPVLNNKKAYTKDRIFSSAYGGDGPGRISYLTTWATVISQDWYLAVDPGGRNHELYRRHLPQCGEYECSRRFPGVTASMLQDLENFTGGIMKE